MTATAKHDRTERIAMTYDWEAFKGPYLSGS